MIVTASHTYSTVSPPSPPPPPPSFLFLTARFFFYLRLVYSSLGFTWSLLLVDPYKPDVNLFSRAQIP